MKQLSLKSFGGRSTRSKFSQGDGTSRSGSPNRTQRMDALTQYERENAVLKKAQHLKERKAKERRKKLKKIALESRKTLMLYSKTSNVLDQFAQEQRDKICTEGSDSSDTSLDAGDLVIHTN